MRLIINGIEAVMNVDEKLQINFVNQLLQQQGFFSYPITLPLRPNWAIFGYLRIQKSDRPTNMKFELRQGAIVICRGNVSIDTFMERSVAIILNNESSGFWKTTGEAFMDEFDFGGEDNRDITTALSHSQVIDKWTASCFLKYPQSPYSCYPVYAPNFLPDAFGYSNQVLWLPNGYPGPIINEWNHKDEKLRDADVPTANGPAGNIFALHFYVRYLIDQIITKSGFTKGIDELSLIPDFSALSIISMNQVVGFTLIEYKRSLPHMKIVDFMKSLEDTFGITLDIDLLRNTINVRLKRTLLQKSNGKSYSSMRTYDTEISTIQTNTKGFLVKWTSDDDSDRNYNDIETELYVTQIANKSLLPEASQIYSGSMYHIQLNDRYLICQLQEKKTDTDPDVWKWESAGLFRPLSIGDGSESREIKAKTVVNHTETRVYNYMFYSALYPQGVSTAVTVPFQCPSTQEKGNSGYGVYFCGVKPNEWPVQFVVTRGSIEVSDGQNQRHKFPFATFDNYTEEGALLVSDFNLRFEGIKGLYNQFLLDELAWLMRREWVQTYLVLPLSEIKNIDMAEKININGCDRIIDSLNAEFSNDDMVIVELDNWI